MAESTKAGDTVTGPTLMLNFEIFPRRRNGELRVDIEERDGLSYLALRTWRDEKPTNNAIGVRAGEMRAFLRAVTMAQKYLDGVASDGGKV